MFSVACESCVGMVLLLSSHADVHFVIWLRCLWKRVTSVLPRGPISATLYGDGEIHLRAQQELQGWHSET